MTSASTILLVGWDDIKGRPIYSKKSQQAVVPASAKKKAKAAPIKKGAVLVTARKTKAKTKRPRGHHSKNGNGRRNIPTVQVAVGSLMAGITADYNDNCSGELLYEEQINQQSSCAPSKPARKVSFSPTSHHDTDTKKRRDFNNSKPSTKSWDSNKKRRGYGSKKFARGSGYYNISPIFVLDGNGAGEDTVEWGGTPTSVGNDFDDTISVATTERLDSHQTDVRSVANDDDFSSTGSKNDNDVDLSFAVPTETVPKDIQSVGYESIHSSLDSESNENHSRGSFSYGHLDYPDEFDCSHSRSSQQNDSIPEMIHVETDFATANDDDEDVYDDDDDDDLTAKAEGPSSTIDNSDAGHHTPSTKTAEDTSYKLHSGGTNDFIDYDVPLDEASANEIVIQGKRRSYGCSEKPVWASNKRSKASAADTAIISGNAVGWDEVKCRPIFHAKSKKKVDENELGTNVCDVGDDVASDDASNANMKSHKRRHYSSRFRKTSLTKAIEQMSVLSSPEKADGHIEGEESAQGLDDCSEEDINVDDCAQGQESSQRQGGRLGDDFDLDDGANNEAHEESNMDFDSEMEEVAINENVCRIQPTESSSLEAARAFFRYLDSSHRLVVDQGDTSPRISSEVIRTTRRIVHSDQLRTEYSEYCDMLAQTGVAPITITEFANNWNRYFVGKGIRDGLFDED